MRSALAPFLVSLLVGALAVAALGCGGSDTEPTGGCAYPIGGACAGVPSDALCASDPCTDGITCASIVSVSTPAALTSALGAAQLGTCVALAAGTYPAVTLPAGVSLLGNGAGGVSVAGVTIQSGQGAVVRGLTIGASGLHIDAATKIRIDAVRVASASADAVDLTGGADVTVTRSEITGAADVGVRATDAAALAIDTTVVVNGSGPGIAAICSAGCGCASPPTVAMTRSIVRDAMHVGVFLSGVHATLGTVLVANTQVRGLEVNSGGGIVAAACSDVTATGLTIDSSAFFGMLVDSSHAKLGDNGETNGIIIHANVLGLWMQGATATGAVTNAQVNDNQGVGIGASGVTNGIIIHASEIRRTKMKTLAVTDGGSKDVGDGLLWTAASRVAIDGLITSDSDRQPILIDGSVAAGSSLANVTLETTDATKGILQQSFASGDVEPSLGAGVTIATDPTQRFQLPVGPAAPKP